MLYMKHLVIFRYCLVYSGYYTWGLDRYHVLCSRRAWLVELDLFCHSYRSKYSVTRNSNVGSQKACSHPWCNGRCVFEVLEGTSKNRLINHTIENLLVYPRHSYTFLYILSSYTTLSLGIPWNIPLDTCIFSARYTNSPFDYSTPCHRK